jgi:hypothetical protein
MAFRLPIPASKAVSTTFVGHFSWQSPQPVHFSSSTDRARLRMRTVNWPTYPETSSTSL